MKRERLFIALLLLALAACSKPQETPGVEKYLDQYNTMQQLVDAGVDYDITKVEELLVEQAEFWQLDAVLGYDANYTKVERVYRDFADSEGRGDDDFVLRFGGEDTVFCCDLDSVNGTIDEQQGGWSYNARTLMLTLNIPEFGDNVEVNFEAMLLSLTAESMVLEWSDEGKAKRASLRRGMTYYDLCVRSANVIAQNIMAQCRDFDAEALVQGLPGTWSLDSKFAYDENRESVEDLLMLLGVQYAEGGFAPQFVFEQGGVGAILSTNSVPPFEDTVVNFEWRYDAESGNLVLECVEGDAEYTKEYFVAGYSDEYLVLDYKSLTGVNMRDVYKRE